MVNYIKMYAACMLILFTATQHCMEPESESIPQIPQEQIVIVEKDQAGVRDGVPGVTCEAGVKVITDEQLLDLVKNFDKSLFVNFIKFCAQEKNVSLTPENIRSLLRLTPETINTLFLDNVDNDFIREFALSLGADINTLSSTGSNCLFRTHDPRILKILLTRGAQVDGNKKDMTPLYYHCGLWDREEIALAELFLVHGANPENPNDPGRSLLHKAIDKSNAALVKLLCQHKANVHQKDSLQRTPLILATAKKSLAMVNTLLEHGAAEDINTLSEFYGYPLYEAVSKTKDYRTDKYTPIVPAIIISLLEHGADPNMRHPRYENYPIHCALENVGRIEIKEVVEAFIKHKVSLELCDLNDRRPLELAQKRQHSQEIIDLLAKNSVVKTAALSASGARQPLPDPTVVVVSPQQKSWFSLWG